MTRHFSRTLLLAALVTCALPALPAAADEEKETKALAAAEAWLALVDGDRFEESWKQAAEYFRTAVTAEQWAQALAGARVPLGDSVARKVESKQYATSLPGAPDGEYVVIRFRSSFERKAEAVETVTPMLDADGQWRVAGYFIR